MVDKLQPLYHWALGRVVKVTGSRDGLGLVLQHVPEVRNTRGQCLHCVMTVEGNVLP